MSRRVLPVAAVAAAAGLLPVLLATPALAESSAAPRTAAPHAAAVRVAAAGSGVKATISVTTSVRTAHAGRYGKFGVSFRCERGLRFDLLGVVEQDDRHGDPVALAFSDDDSPTGTCTGRTQRRTIYVAADALPDGSPSASPGGVDKAPSGGKVAPLRTGRGTAQGLLLTSSSRHGRPEFAAATLATVRVHPR